MAFVILFALITVPILEIAVFIQVGGILGLATTLAVVVLTAVIGTALLRIQGLAALTRVQASLQQGHLPMADVFDGLCLLVAGALLLTPGFITDAVGFLLFVPTLRGLLRRGLGRYLAAKGKIHLSSTSRWDDATDSTVLDGEFVDITPDDETRNDSRNDADTKGTSGPPRRLP